MSELEITDNFPTGNVVVQEIDGDYVYLRQDQRDTTRRWFYWHFAVCNAAGRNVMFEFTDWDVIGPLGPVVSTDHGESWAWLGREDHEQPRFTYRFPPNAGEVHFCFCIPYSLTDWHAFLAKRSELKADMLCTTREGRPVEMLTLGDPDASQHVLVTARHHCCESAASFVLEGLVDQWRAAMPADIALVVVPMVDLDGVERGDQGKGRNEHDYNRDYVLDPHYPETTAIMNMVRRWHSPPAAALDLHSPNIRGKWSQQIYLVGSSGTAVSGEQQRLLEMITTQEPTELPITDEDYLPFGQDWNTNEGSDNARSCARWMGMQGARLPTTLEIPYADVRGVEVTPKRLRDAGVSICRGLHQWLMYVNEAQ